MQKKRQRRRTGGDICYLFVRMNFLPIFSLETWVLVFVLLALLLLYGTWPYNHFKKLGIPGPRPLPFLGSILEYQHGFVDFDRKCRQKYGKIWGLFDGRQPVLAIVDPTIIKLILVKDFYTHFTDRRDFGVSGNLDGSVFTAPFSEWKRIRTVLSPTFTSGKLKEMMPIISRYSEALVNNVQKRVENDESIDMKAIFGAYSMDVVTSTSFSIDVDSVNNPDDPFLINLRKLINFNFIPPAVILTAVFPFLIPLVSKLKISLVSSSVVNFLLAAVKKIKKERQESSHMDRVDLLQLMLESQISGNVSDGTNTYKALSDKEILVHAVVFILAGYEATSTSLSFLSYTLATQPTVQQKLQEEIDRILPNKAAPTYDAIQRMEYLDMVLNENMRIYTSTVRIDRVCKQTTEINGIIIPKGTVVIIPTSVLHQDPEYWPEPDEFRPERFSKENRDSMDPYTFMPFGAGPKICIGMRFALLNLKVAIVSLLQKFSFRPCKETPICMQTDSRGFLKPKKPIILKMVHRKPVACEE